MRTSERSLIECRRRKWPAELVERWNPHSHTRHDLFNAFDILALPGEGLLGIQACGTDLQSHLKKLEENPLLDRWLVEVGGVEVWSWRKLKVKRGGKAVRWCLKRVQAHLTEDGITWSEET